MLEKSFEQVIRFNNHSFKRNPRKGFHKLGKLILIPLKLTLDRY